MLHSLLNGHDFIVNGVRVLVNVYEHKLEILQDQSYNIFVEFNELEIGVNTIDRTNEKIIITVEEDKSISAIEIISKQVTTEEELREVIESGESSAVLGATIELTAPLTFKQDQEFTLSGNGYSLKASKDIEAIDINGKSVKSVVYLEEALEDTKITLENINIDGNNVARGVTVYGGELTLGTATFVKNGVCADDLRSGGVYVTSDAKLVIDGATINENDSGETELLATNYGHYYSADLWVGANASVTMLAGDVGYVFVNANEYSETNQGAFWMFKGTIDTMYLEFDVKGAVLNYSSGSINRLLISSEVAGEPYTPVIIIDGVTSNLDKYEGGVNPNPAVEKPGDDPVVPDPGDDDDDGQVYE
jgi:hypothetical protein